MTTPGERQPHPPVGGPDPHLPGGTPHPHPPVGTPDPCPPAYGAPTGRVADGGEQGERLSTAPGPGVPFRSHGPRVRFRPRTGLALLAGVGIVALYLAGAAVSGRASILHRRPLLDGLAPPTPYRWVTPPPDLAAGNKPPASTRFTLELTAKGTQLGAFSTCDGQINLVLSQGAVPASSGQEGVEVTVDPVDPATLGPVPSGLVAAGNAYRVKASYQPSGDAVEALGGQSSVGLVYPLLSTAVSDPGGHQVLSSADGQAWETLQSTDTPGTHQVSARLTRTGYVLVGVAPSAAGSQSGSRNRILLLGSAIAVVIVAAAVLLRLRERTRATPPGRGRPR